VVLDGSTIAAETSGAFGVDCGSNLVNVKTCNPAFFPSEPAAFDQALGYYLGLANYFNVVSIGTSFQATGGSGNVTLTWVESNPGRTVTYQLFRSDNCHGPYALLDYVDAHDPAFTPDDMNYTYVDDTVSYSRPYFYRIIVTTEKVDDSATPSGLPSASPPSVPTNVTATLGTGVSLSWSPSTGTVDGYRIYRTDYIDIEDCNTSVRDLGTTTTTGFVDASAPSGIPLFYHVLAYNAEGVSSLAPGVTIAVTTDSNVPTEREFGDELSIDVLDNGTVFAFAVGRATHATIAVYDVRGRLVAVPHSRAVSAGEYRIGWNGRWRHGQVGSGVYFAKLVTPEGASVARKFIMVR